MAKQILVCSEKGGCGKSTVADELAFALDRKYIPYTFYDLDGQGGTIHAGHKAYNPEAIIIDTPAGINDTTVEAMTTADVVVITTNPTPREVEPLTRTLEIVRKNAPQAKVVVVVNRENRFRVASQFMSWLEEQVGYEQVFTLPQSEMFPQADGLGISVVEHDKKGLARMSVQTMCSHILFISGLGLKAF